jgi:hypothetical protein
VARTSYILSVIPWQEPVTLYQLYRGKNQLHFFSYTVARTSYILSVIQWQEPVTYQQSIFHGLTSSVAAERKVDHMIETQLGQMKDYKIGICCCNGY